MPNQPLATAHDIGQKSNSHVFIEWRALSCPKKEYDAETTEDRWAANASAGLFAVADGVGSSFRAADWALALVNAWTQTPFHSNYPFEVEWWARKLQPRFAISQEEISRLQPYAQKQAHAGSGSTLLGLRLWPSHDNKTALYELLCIGDSNLFHYPKVAYPITDAEKFGSYPSVLRSKGYDRRADAMLRYPETPAGDSLASHGRKETPTPLQRLAPGDTLILCTDALAKWILETDKRAYYDKSKKTPTALERFSQATPENWQAFIEDLRNRGRIVDDDTTALFIRIAKDQKAPASDEVDPQGWRRVALAFKIIERQEHDWTSARRAEMATTLSQRPVSVIEVARVFGDGYAFGADYPNASAVAALAQKGRERADALDQINDALRAVSWDHPTREQLERAQTLRQQYGDMLGDEPVARGALATIAELLARPIDPAPSQTGAPATQPEMATDDGEQTPTAVSAGQEGDAPQPPLTGRPEEGAP